MTKNILIIDDSASIRELVSHTLKQAGFSVDQAGNGPQGLNALDSAEKNYALIITDLFMPKMDGIQVIREIRKKTPFRFTPILMLTTDRDPKNKEHAQEAGATGWVTKPFDDDGLIKVVKKIIRS